MALRVVITGKLMPPAFPAFWGYGYNKRMSEIGNKAYYILCTKILQKSVIFINYFVMFLRTLVTRAICIMLGLENCNSQFLTQYEALSD